jgi:predicted phosphodiesterase
MKRVKPNQNKERKMKAKIYGHTHTVCYKRQFGADGFSTNGGSDCFSTNGQKMGRQAVACTTHD